jgi:hypothetical protein
MGPTWWVVSAARAHGTVETRAIVISRKATRGDIAVSLIPVRERKSE